MHSELLVDVLEMLADCAGRDSDRLGDLGDLGVGLARGNQLDDLALALA